MHAAVSLHLSDATAVNSRQINIDSGRRQLNMIAGEMGKQIAVPRAVLGGNGCLTVPTTGQPTQGLW
jgi:hypothetical protein